MPKIGVRTAEPERPHVLRCVNCGCVGLSRLTTRFTPWGTPVGMIYACDQWPVAHRCDTAEREGCTPERVYMDVIHIVDARTGDGTTKNLHPGPREACTLKQCAVEKDMTDPWEPPAGPLPPWPGPLAGDEDE